MPTLDRIDVAWSGSAVVGGGISVFYCQDGDQSTCITALRAFFDAIKSGFPNTLQWTFPTSGQQIDEATGNVVGAWSAGSTGAVTGDGTGTYANGVGARAVWSTIGVVGGRHVRGSTFLAPLVVGTYEGAGNIVAATLAYLVPAANALATTPNGIRIYSRKTAAHAGVSFPALAGTVPDKVSWLRSRRT